MTSPSPSSEAPIRVVHLVLSLEAGGLEGVVLELARATEKSAVEMRVLCLEGKGALAPRLEAVGVPVEALEAANRVGALRALVPRLRWLRPHVLHSHNLKPHVVAAVARRLLRIPVLVHTKHGRNEPHTWRSILWSRVASLATDAVVPVSEDAARVVRDLERVPADRVVVIHNGIDPNRFAPPRPHSASQTLRAVCVARFEDVKDHATLLHAARLVADVEPSFRLDLVGDGPRRQALQELSARLDLEGVVRFVGQLSDVGPELRKADLFVLASRSEGLSMAILEAMGAGLPVVATRVGGNPEIVLPGETGLLVPPASPEALAEAVRSLARDHEARRRMGQAGRRRVEESFDTRTTARRYVDLYRELLAKRSASAQGA